MNQWIVPAASLVALAVAAFLLFMSRSRHRYRARVAPNGAQEMEIVVLDGYTPSTAIVREGIPVRLKFTRLESNEYSRRVIFSDFKLERRLAPYRTTVVEFTPPSPGEYLFTSDMGMYRGRLVVEPCARKRRRLPALPSLWWQGRATALRTEPTASGRRQFPCLSAHTFSAPSGDKDEEGDPSMLTENSVTTRRPASRAGAAASTRRRSKVKARFLVAGFVIVAAIAYMIFAAMQSGSEYFVTTGELAAMGSKAIGQPTKLGGRVVEGSVQRDRGSSTITFALTDGSKTLPVVYKGVVPDSFQEGVDVIVEGKLGTDGSFQATSLMAKCASKYVPADTK